MTDQKLRGLERRWNETQAHDDRTALELELYRAGRPFAEAMLRTRGGLILTVNTPECTFSKYVSEKNRLVNRFMWRAEETRTQEERTASHAVDTTYARLSRVDDVIRNLMDINHDEGATIYHGRAAIREFARNNDFASIKEIITVDATPIEFIQTTICEYLARGREEEAYELRGDTLPPDEQTHVDAAEINHALAEFHASHGRYDTATQLLTNGTAPTILAEFLTRAAATRKDYDNALKFSDGYPLAQEIAAQYAARNNDYDAATTFAESAKFRSAAAHLAIIEEAAAKRDYAIARDAMSGAFALSGQANRAYWRAAIRNGDFEIAAPYAPRNRKQDHKEDLAIGNLRRGNLSDAQKFARTAPSPSRAYCNLALALSGKELIGDCYDD